MGIVVNLRSMKINPQGYFARVQTFTDADDVINALKLGLIDVGVANTSPKDYQSVLKLPK